MRAHAGEAAAAADATSAPPTTSECPLRYLRQRLQRRLQRRLQWQLQRRLQRRLQGVAPPAVDGRGARAGRSGEAWRTRGRSTLWQSA